MELPTTANKTSELMAYYALELRAIRFQDSCQFREAIECNEKLVKYYLEIGARKLAVVKYGDLGVAYRHTGDWRKAIQCHEKELEIGLELKDVWREGCAYCSLANIYRLIGDYEKALECSKKDIIICLRLKDRNGEAGGYGNLGNVYCILGQFDRAVWYHQKQLTIAKENDFKAIEAMGYSSLGNVYRYRGELEDARICYTNCIKIARRPIDKAVAYGGLGYIYDKTGEYDKAIEYHRLRLNLFKESGIKDGMARAYASIAGVIQCRGNGENGKACEFYCRAILAMDPVRRSVIYQDEFNTSVADQFAQYHGSMMKCLLNLHQVKTALLIADAGKAKALKDLMRKRANLPQDSTDHKHYTTWIKTILADPSSSLCEKLLDDVTSNVIQSVQDGSVVIYNFDATGTLHTWVIANQKIFHTTSATSNGISLWFFLKILERELSQCLDARSATDILDKSTDSGEAETKGCAQPKIPSEEMDTSFGKVLKRRLESVKTASVSESRMQPSANTELKNKEESMRRLKMCYNLDCSFSASEQNCSNKACYAGLEDATKTFERYGLDQISLNSSSMHLSRAEAQPSKFSRHYTDFKPYLLKLYSVLIAPVEGHLTGTKLLFVPAGPLLKLPLSAFMNSEEEHLCERYSIQVTPALHTLNTSLKSPLKNPGPALFVGDPRVGKVHFRRGIATPTPLPNAATEAEECASYFRSKALLSRHATKANVLRKMKDASVIHIAAHGDMEYADILLAPNAGASNPAEEKDYLLRAADVTGCTLEARLVVLSCCHSGRGPVTPEGVNGIARSFLGAGARSVLVTLWKISDEKTVEIMKRFYESVCQGNSACVALQRALKSVKEGQSIADWAPFEIFGEDVTFSKDDIEEIRGKSSKM